MTPGALATRERVRPPSMTSGHRLVSRAGVSSRATRIPPTVVRSGVGIAVGTELIEAERRASRNGSSSA